MARPLSIRLRILERRRESVARRLRAARHDPLSWPVAALVAAAVLIAWTAFGWPGAVVVAALVVLVWLAGS